MDSSFVARLVLLALPCSVAWGCSGSAPEPSEPVFEAVPASVAERAATVRDRALASPGAYELLAALTTEVGPRFAGTAGNQRAVEWARRKLEELEFDQVWTEEVTVPHWVRGEAAGEIVAPWPQKVALVALGGSVGTPAGGIEAEVIEVSGLDALEGLDPAAVAGKIVFINQRMQRARDGSGYGETVPIRSRGPARAGARGAVAVLIRSVGTSNNRLAHTGGTRYEDDAPKIPAAALSNPDADLLSAEVESGESVRFRLELGSHTEPDAPSANVFADVRGSERPEEIVLLAAHLDSWDLGTGAIDDGAGCAIVTEAARLISELDPRPKRTIRVFLAANEEFGLSGARAYGERHADDMARHVAATESDFGAGRVWSMSSRVAETALPIVRDLALLLKPLGIEYGDNDAHGGADLRPLRDSQVPFFDLRQDGSLYFDYHHTANDTLDKVAPEDLAQNVAAAAVTALVLADLDVSFGPAAPFPEEPGR
jgi:carboxypeptidase Q